MPDPLDSKNSGIILDGIDWWESPSSEGLGCVTPEQNYGSVRKEEKRMGVW